ncbi:MAG: hypothetical protein P8O16_00445 [Algoriphagus sp.]|uniref:hypothetical protein n=1 Tax=Algoriphagus sp. TaxID=1872435 RepID=UPI0026150E74|nr:hypothetical protein [Algoriphagus sp.]MDG1275716.1 hypothetical protein [Algoriphagus sp.]
MKKLLHPARLILCFLAFYFPFVLSSAGQSLSDLELSSQVSEGVNQGSRKWVDYYEAKQVASWFAVRHAVK